MFFLSLEYDLKYFKVSLRKFAMKQLSIKNTRFIYRWSQGIHPREYYTSRCISAGTLLVTLMRGLSIRFWWCSYYQIWLALVTLPSHWFLTKQCPCWWTKQFLWRKRLVLCPLAWLTWHISWKSAICVIIL